MNIRSSAASAVAASGPRYAFGYGARYTSGANGPSPFLYGCVFDVIVSAIHVRPWNAPSNAMTACRFVYSRDELHRVLDRLGAGVEERAARLAADRDERAEPLGELHVALVRHDGEVRVQEAVGLLGDRLDDARMVVTDVRDAHAADEVDERVAVDVRDRGAARAIGDDRARGRSADARRPSARARGSPGCVGPESPSGSRSRGSPPRAGA